MIGQIATETGWSVDYILDRVNVVTLQLMMADMPHYVKPKQPSDKGNGRKGEETGRNAAGRGNTSPQRHEPAGVLHPIRGKELIIHYSLLTIN